MSYQEVITIAAGVVSTGLIAGTEASGADAGKIVIEDGGTLIGGTIREGGTLSAVYGAVVSDLTAETGAVVEISDGAKTSGALLTGANTNIAEGTLYYNGAAITGNVVNGTLSNLDGIYRICVGDGITVTDPVLGSSVRIYAQSGSIVSGGTINTSGNIGLLGDAYGNGVTVGGEGITTAAYNLFDTAVADNTTVNAGGAFTLRAGNVAHTVTVNDGGKLNVSNGGVVHETTLNSGATLNLYNGGEIYETTVNDGAAVTVKKEQTANTITVNSGGSLTVSSGAEVHDVTINRSGTLTVKSGGTAYDVVATPGALFSVTGGRIIGGIFTGNATSYTQPWLQNGAYIENVTLTNEEAFATPRNSCWLRLGNAAGNRASGANITVKRGAKLQVNNGYAENTVTMENGGIVVYGNTTDLSLAHHTVVSSAGSAYVNNRAGMNTASMTDTWILSGGTGIVGNTAGDGGAMLDTVVNSGGKLTVSSGAVATVDEHPWLDKANVTVKTGGTVTYGRFHNIYYGTDDGQTGLVSRWEETTGLAVEAGHSAVVYDGGDLRETTVQEGGLLKMSGGSAVTVTLESGGSGAVTKGAVGSVTLESGGTLTLTGGSAAGVTMEKGGKLELKTGAVVYDVVADPGAQFTLLGGTIIGGTFTGNKTNTTTPYASNGTFIKGVTLTTDVGYSTPQNYCWLRIGNTDGIRASAADVTVKRGAKFQINNGYVENTVTMEKGGIIVYGNAANTEVLAHHTIVSSGGSAYVYNKAGNNTASMTDTWIMSGGTGIVGNATNSGGTMLDTVLNPGGTLTVHNLAVATIDEHPWLDKTKVTSNTGATVTYGRFHNVYYGAGDGKTGLVSRGDTMDGLEIAAGHSAVVYEGGELNNATVYTGGSAIMSSGAAVRGLTVSGNARMAAAVSSAGVVYGASAYDPTVGSGGYIKVESGSYLSGVVIESGGSIHVSHYAQMEDVTVKNGGQIDPRTANIAVATLSRGLTLDLTGPTEMNQYMVLRYIGYISSVTVRANGAVGDYDYLLCKSAGGESFDNPFTLNIGGNTYATNAAVTEIVDPFAGMVYSRTRSVTSGSVYDLKLLTRVSAHTIATVDTAAALVTGGTDLNIADREARWTADTAMTSAVNVAAGMTAGNAWLELDGANLTKALYGTAENQAFTGVVNYKVNAGTTVKQLAAGAAKGGSVAAVNVDIDGGSFTNAFYAGGFGDVTGQVKVDIADGDFTTNVFAGALCNYRATHTATSAGDIVLEVADGAFSKCLYAAAAVTVGSDFGAAAPVHTVEDITVELSGGTAAGADFCVYGGGYAAGTNAAGNTTAAYEVEDVEITISGGTWGSGVRGGRGIFGGVYASGVIASVEEVEITITGGTVQNVYGGGWAQSNGTSIIREGVEITIAGGSVGHVFGGGSYSSSSGGTTAVGGDVEITITGGTINGNIYAGGQNENSTVAGDVTVTFAGAGSYSCAVYGYVTPPSATEGGVKTLDLTEFTGTLSGAIGGFDAIAFSAASTATLTAAADKVDNGEWVFDLAGTAGASPILTWEGGSFAGDTVELDLTGATAPAAGWQIATGLTDADAAFTVNIGDASKSLVLGERIWGGVYDGYGFSFDGENGGVLKFSKLA